MGLFSRKKKKPEEALKTEPSGAERRRWPRIKLDARVVIAYPDVEKLVTGPLSDISLGGAFIRTGALKPIGTVLTLKVMVTKDDLEFEARGKVVRTVTIEQARERGSVPGMGVAFEDLTDQSKAALERLLAAVNPENQADS